MWCGTNMPLNGINGMAGMAGMEEARSKEEKRH
jgi:hypothetical protein